MKVKVKIITDDNYFIIKATGHAKHREDCSRITTALEVFANQNGKDIVFFTQTEGKTFITGTKQDNFYNFVKYLKSLTKHYPITIIIEELNYEQDNQNNKTYKSPTTFQ